MAGIGFELKKLFVGGGAIRKARAYAYASIVCAGTMLLAMVLLIGIQRLALLSGVNERQREALVAMVVYAMLFSMLLAAILQTLISRYVSDMIYRDTPDRVIPSLIGASLLLMVPGGIAYGILLLLSPEIPAVDRALNWVLFMELIPVWLQMAYITAVKDYRRILRVFAAGVLAALVLGAALILSGQKTETPLLAVLVVGYGVMLTGFMRVLLRYFPSGSGSAFAFIEWFSRTPQLALVGFFGMAGVFVHLIVMWFGPLGESVTGLFRHAPTYDPAAFYAYLVTLPASVNFVVSVEVNFYREYRRYFDAVNGGGTLSEISEARGSMFAMMRQEFFRLARFQVYFMVPYAVLMPYFLSTIGFTADMILLFQIMCVGYSAYAIGNSAMLLQLYFNDLNGALMTSAAFFAVNWAVSAWTLHGPPLYYGIGLVAGGVAMYLTSLPRLFGYVRNIDFHVFCEQPVLATEKAGRWLQVAAWLEAASWLEGADRERPAAKPDREVTL